MNIKLLPDRFDVHQLQVELENFSGWNWFPMRTQGNSPHRECDDIWVRWQNGAVRADGSFDCEWYGVAHELPSAVALCQLISDLYMGIEMGGVLITRIPPGKQVYPHVDRGWHAHRYEKFAIQVKGNSEQSFCFQEERLSPQSGELFWFDNSKPHWVLNPSAEERITLICCIRRDH